MVGELPLKVVALQSIHYGGLQPSAVRGVEATGASNNEVEEIARYDLSGRPCSPKEKGVQIIVYSDFMTKTILVD